MSALKWLWLVMVSSALALAGPITLINPGFETGDFTGWTQSGNTGYTDVFADVAHSGTYSAYFGPIGSVGYISQNVTTVPGGVYDVTFYLMGSGSPNAVEIWWDGSLAMAWENVNQPEWTLWGAFDLVASGSSTELRLGFRNDPAYIYIDDVEVNGESAIPEPSTVVLSLAGAGLLGLLARRRR